MVVLSPNALCPATQHVGNPTLPAARLTKLTASQGGVFRLGESSSELLRADLDAVIRV